jgi:serine/threonine-protein kinase
MSTRAGGSEIGFHLERFEREFPRGDVVRRLIRSLGIDPIFASAVAPSLRAPTGSWSLQVRLPRTLEDSFGFTRPFVIYCLDSRDLQPRNIDQLKRLIANANPSVTNDFALIVSMDPEANTKLRDWAVERADGIVVVAVTPDGIEALLADPAEAPQAIPRLLEQAFHSRNLYDERDPVHGDRFFGRADDLRELDRLISHGNRHIGIFGLRRIGKTSLLLELIDRLRRRAEVLPIFVNLEISSAAPSAAHIAWRLGDEVAAELARGSKLTHNGARRALGIPNDWAEVPPGQLMTDLATSLVAVLTSGGLSGRRLVAVLDEAEILLPNTREPMTDAIHFLRMIRGVSQQTEQLTLVMAGVNATPSESPVIADDDNPLFRLLSVRYLGPLDVTSCSDLIRDVGRRMRMRWDPAATRAITTYVGGHPLLARLAASDVWEKHPERPLRPSADMVNRDLQGFHVRNSDIFQQMIQSLQRYYPDELEVLKLIAHGDKEFARSMLAEDPSTLNHLVGYGVVNQETLEISVPAFREWLRSGAAP